MKVQQVANAHFRDGELNGVVADNGHAIAVGFYNDSGDHTLIETFLPKKMAFGTTSHPPTVGQLTGITQSQGYDWGVGVEEKTVAAPVGYSSSWLNKLRTLIFSHKSPPWVRDMTPNVDSNYDGTGLADNYLRAISASSPANVWAVGTATTNWGPTDFGCLAIRWDGTDWSVVDCEQPGVGSTFSAVATLSVNNAWAVGWYFNPTSPVPLIQRWNGKTWSSVATLTLPPLANTLRAVCGTLDSSNNIWVVGENYKGGGPAHPLVLRGHGTVWKHEIMPQTGTLLGVSAASSNDAWAVGWQKKPSGLAIPLTLHWDGAKWNYVPTPPLPTGAALRAVAAVSASEAWAVGVQRNSLGTFNLTLAMRWDGKAWKLVSCL